MAAARRFGDVDKREADLLLFMMEGLVANLAVGLGRGHQNGVARVQHVLKARITFAAPLDATHVPRVGHRHNGILEHSVVLSLDRDLHADSRDAVFARPRPERDELVVQVRVVALDHPQMREGLARHRLALALGPVEDLRLRQFVRRVVQERSAGHVAHGPGKDERRHFAHLFREQLENVPVRFGFPHRRHRRPEHMQERVQVGRVEVVLLVPEGRRQHDVGVERRGIHAEIEVDHQVILSARRRFAVLHPVASCPWRDPRRWRCRASRGNGARRTRAPWRSTGWRCRAR